jgi:predicted helicase
VSKAGSGVGAARAPLGLFDAYIHALQKSDIREKTEHTDRDAVKALIQSLAPAGITVVHEAKGVRGKGTPDFKIRQNGQIVGYVETKPVGTGMEELRRLLKSDQIVRYRKLSPNIVLTDYLNWIWFHNGSVQRGSLCAPEDLSKAKPKLDESNAQKIAIFLAGFLSVAPQKIGRADDLADALAHRTRLLRDFLGDELARQEDEGQAERLYGLYLAFKKQVSEQIDLSEFSDAFAQTLSYGLFLSKLNANGHSLHLGNAKQYVPKSFKLIQELVGFLDVLDLEYYQNIRWVVDEVISIINGLDIPAIQEDLSFRNRKRTSRGLKAHDEEEWRLFSRDPFIYFYEDFLAEYDSALRKSRGVYYTPPPVVNFIVRAIDDVLKTRFGLKNGIGDHKKVTALEFACGTGTFVVEMLERIIDNLNTSSSGKIELAIREHALKNIFAFEYLIAPYTIAHLKLSQYLEDRQIRLGDGEKFNILLTNTLEPIEPQYNFLLPALSEESRRALRVKKQPILVITGNPPYSRFSKNKGKWIQQLVDKYKYIDGKHFGERKHWLDDDYVKFFRFAEHKMEDIERGVIAIITNHAWIDNPTFRGMRQSLRNNFDQIYVLNLRGNTKRKELAPHGVRDENVFDIQQGVAITLLAKTGNESCDVQYADMWGARREKYKMLADSSLSSIKWESCRPVSPFYFFTPNAPKEFGKWFELKGFDDIFVEHATGAVSGRDPLVISFDGEQVKEKKERFLRGTLSDARREFGLQADTRDWTVQRARDDLRSEEAKSAINPISYRPFDTRMSIYTGKSRGLWSQPSQPTAKHILGRENIVLGITRRVEEGDFRHAFVFSHVTDCHAVSSKETTHTFLLWKYGSLPDEERRANIKPELLRFLHKRFGSQVSEEEVFGYVYSILYCEVYREKFEEFLRIDFPRIPFPMTSNRLGSWSGWSPI